MAILVVCPNCTSRFTVSDQFAGRTGPCPKCKKPITVPKPEAQAVTIHEPAPAGTAPGAKPVTVPFRSLDRPVPPLAFAIGGAGAVVFLLAAWLLPGLTSGRPPAWLLLTAAFLVAIPCAGIGYAALRNREMEAYRGPALWLRCIVCAAVWAILWGVRGLLPADLIRELWQWVYIAPPFVLAGALAALAAFDLDWGAATANFSFYVLFTALLRWLAGLPPL